MFQDTGDFDVEVSRVVEVNTRLVSMRLSGETLDSEFDQQVALEYSQFLKSTNTVDLVDVLLRVKEECATNSELKQELNQTQFYVASGFPDTVEVWFSVWAMIAYWFGWCWRLGVNETTGYTIFQIMLTCDVI